MLARFINLALLGLFPIAWMAPLARAEVSWLFISAEISIFSGVQELYKKDLFLCAVVFLFAIVTPYLKTLALAYVQFSSRADAHKLLPILELLGKLSMVDIFLIALYIITSKGLEDIYVEWGLYFFTGLVLASLWVSTVTWRRYYQTVLRDHPGKSFLKNNSIK